MVAEIRERSIVPALEGGNGRVLSSALSSLENGWPFRPFQIVSLLEMLFGTFVYHYIGILRDLECCVSGVNWDRSKHAPNGYFVDTSRSEGYKTLVSAMVAPCTFIGIDISEQVARVHAVLDPDSKSTDQLTKLESRLEEVQFKIEDELKKRSFLYVPPELAVYYDQDALFGEQVSTNFPVANKEIREAGRCYAIGSNTAAVFHLMRAVEHGARVMVKALKVRNRLQCPVELSDWNDLINAMESGLNLAAKGRRQSVSVTERSEFFSHAVGQFRNFKDAWRNNVSHTRKNYLSGETKDIFDNTSQFMRHLATRLKE